MDRAFKVLAGIWLIVTTAAHAGDAEQAVISKLIKAYGGESLTSMTSLIVSDRYKRISRDGGVRPGLDAVSRLHSTLTIDYVQGRKSVKNWRVDAIGKRLGQIMFDGTAGWSINFLRGSHVMREDLTHKRVGAGMMRLLDTTLVRLLIDSVDTAIYEGTATKFGHDHDILRFKINGSVDVTLYINTNTGLITQMDRTNGVHYEYSDHRVKDGITYASDTNQFRNGYPATITLSREIEVNPDVSKAFILPKNTKPLEGMRDVSRMEVKTVGEDVYLVGKGFRSSIFVDTGDYFIAAGSLSGFEARLKAVNEKIGKDKPVRYFVVPEHHPGHMGDIKKIANMGVQLVTVKAHLSSLKKRIGGELSDGRFVLVDGVLDLAEGKVRLHDISSITSEHFLLFYIPGTKLAYTMDEFGTNLLNSVPSADKRMLSFRDAIEAIDIDVQQFAHVHGTGVLTLEQFRQVTDAYQDGFCPDGHAICAE